MATTTLIAANATDLFSSDITLADGASAHVWTSRVLSHGESVIAYRVDSRDSGNIAIASERGRMPISIENGESAMSITGPGIWRLKISQTINVAVYLDS